MTQRARKNSNLQLNSLPAHSHLFHVSRGLCGGGGTLSLVTSNRDIMFYIANKHQHRVGNTQHVMSDSWCPKEHTLRDTDILSVGVIGGIDGACLQLML